MSNDRQNSDQRLFERYSANFPVCFKDCGSGPENEITFRNVSARGLAITACKYLMPNESVSLEVEIPDGRTPMTFDGVVVWSRSNRENSWDVGIQLRRLEFMRMSRITQACLLNKEWNH